MGFASTTGSTWRTPKLPSPEHLHRLLFLTVIEPFGHYPSLLPNVEAFARTTVDENLKNIVYRVYIMHMKLIQRDIVQRCENVVPLHCEQEIFRKWLFEWLVAEDFSLR